MPDEQLEELRARFQSFADETRGRSPLYEHVTLAIARNEDVMSLLQAAAEPQRRPNLLFAAVHDLLLSGTDHPLAAYYPSVGGSRAPDRRTFSTFVSFLDSFRDEVTLRLQTRATQTNEVGRCAALRPGLARLAASLGRPITLIDLGASAGLLLHLDRYRYLFGEQEVGSDTSGVTVAPEMRGARISELRTPDIVQRVAIDLNPLDPSNSGDATWLKACVWPEDVDRLARLDAALTIASSHNDVQFMQGDFVAQLGPAIARAPEATLPCVLHSAALAYLDENRLRRVNETLDEAGSHRTLARLAFEGPFVEPYVGLARERFGAEMSGDAFLLGTTTWRDGIRTDELLARANAHGAWLEWLG